MTAAFAQSNEPPRLHTHQSYIENVLKPATLDVKNPLAVFAYVLNSLPDRVKVYPTENYFYFSFELNGSPFAGNIRLDASDRDQGKVQFGYFEQTTGWRDDTPSLYRVRTELVVKGEVVDAVDTVLGIRSAVFDVDRGLLINGKPYKMRGMCIHHDAGAVGSAIPDALLEHRLALLKEMGCNAIRCSHNPMAPEFYDICDRLGLLVMDEAFDVCQFLFTHDSLLWLDRGRFSRR